MDKDELAVCIPVIGSRDRAVVNHPLEAMLRGVFLHRAVDRGRRTVRNGCLLARQRSLHSGTLFYPPLEAQKRLRYRYAELLGPAQRHVEIAIGDAQLVSKQIVSTHARGCELQQARDSFPRLRLFGLRTAVPHRLEGVVKLTRDKCEHLQLARAGKDTVVAKLGVLLGDPIQHRDVLGEDLAIVEHERRHIALRIDGEEILAGGGFLGWDVNSFDFKLGAGFEQCDVVGQAARAWCIVESHHGRAPSYPAVSKFRMVQSAVMVSRSQSENVATPMCAFGPGISDWSFSSAP